MPSTELADLAIAAGIDPAYTNFRGEPAAASAQALLLALAAIAPEAGFVAPTRADDRAAIAAARAAIERARWDERCPPVVVGWDGALAIPFAVPASVDAAWEIAITLEGGGGDPITARGRLFDLPADQHAWPGGEVHCVRRAALDHALPLGYHALTWRVGDREGRALAIVAPTRAHAGPGEGARRWGVFAPVYGLADAHTGLAGDLGTLRALFEAVGARGGSYVATLPILAADLPARAGQSSASFSPYSPVSRLFWNDLYLDLAALAREHGLAAPRPPVAPVDGELVDYPAQDAWRRAAFAPIAAAIAADPVRAAEVARWAEAHDVYDFAAFRAIAIREGTPWRAWPPALRDGAPHARSRAEAIALAGGDADAIARVDAHAIAQHAIAHQLATIDAHGDHVALYLDLPVGVSCDAYEVWRWRDQFLTTLAAGAPPDALFLGGQNWGLPPLAPGAQRRDGYRYFRRCVQHHMHAAGMLRVDHVMGMFRLYCVPEGRPATDGVYLRYPAEELLAILALESVRARCALVGEDLGTVPPHVRPAMARHAMFRLHVGQWHLPATVGDGVIPSPAESVASLNTHDTATFAGWWHGADIDDRRGLGLITEAQEAAERDERARARDALRAHAGTRWADVTDEVARMMAVATEDLAAGPAEVVLVALDDLALETMPHNVPGTTTERPNWHHRVRGWATALDHPVIAAVVSARPRR